MPDTAALEAIQDDCLHLLMTTASFRHFSETFDPNRGSRLDLHMAMIQLRAIENDIVVRICRFDDEGPNQVSLRYAAKAARAAGLRDADIKVIDARVKKFRQTINPLKTRLRNQHVGHLAAGVTQPHDALGLMSPESVLAWCWEPVRIVDLLAQTSCAYGLEPTRGQQLDLRAYCGVDSETFPPLEACVLRGTD
ncbi:hypothetical protein GCM10009868_40820 [Terrabacter aerolatus]|uniref:HEPN AbiU2-like domain-containing protein n=1 Tax=Terrabacter aerolatus TaxID=422442 RepID=A0A512D5Z6_9MICO|nr:hypothetical protein [Terrabacter aerolatus]GEO31896.1 hypothetical protein TAE01_37060 [Terrabacter aerolatus]